MAEIVTQYLLPRRTAVLGVHFLGGEEQADQIIAWLASNGIKAEWYSVIEINGKPTSKEKQRQGELRFSYADNWWYAFPGEWIMLEPNGTVTVLTDEQKKATYYG